MIDVQHLFLGGATINLPSPMVSLGLKDHDGHAQQFQALVQEDIARVVLAEVAAKVGKGWLGTNGLTETEGQNLMLHLKFSIELMCVNILVILKKKRIETCVYSYTINICRPCLIFCGY